MRTIVLAIAIALGVSLTAAQPAPRTAPTVDQILSLKRAGFPEISPDARFVAYTIR